jgi:hypothetical protein
MNKNLLEALKSACIRLLNDLGSHIGDTTYPDVFGFIEDVASTLETLQNDKPFMQMHPDILAEALAYECQQPQPNTEVILQLAFLCKTCEDLMKIDSLD